MGAFGCIHGSQPLSDLWLRPAAVLGAAMRRPAVSTVVVAFVLPLRVAAWAAGALGVDNSATRLRAPTVGVPIAAYVVTGVVWFPLLVSGIFYPVFDAGNLRSSWGGPTLVGAWVTHLAPAFGLLLAVAFPFALWRPPGTISGKHRSSGQLGIAQNAEPKASKSFSVRDAGGARFGRALVRTPSRLRGVREWRYELRPVADDLFKAL